LFALFTEHGPYEVTSTGTGVTFNKHAWNLRSNMIFVESPCGVGFSYAEDKNYTTGDTDVAHDSYVFVHKWFDLFPEFQNNRFFVSGESYAGHYVPQLVNNLLYPEAPLPKMKQNFNLQGVLVGNPSTDRTIETETYFGFFRAHNLISSEDWATLTDACKLGFLNQTQACKNEIEKVRGAIGPINPYNIYAQCDGPPSHDGYCLTSHFMANGNLKNGPNGQTFIPCIKVDHVEKYLNSKQVQEALHVTHAPPAGKWTPRSDILQYNEYADSVIPLYRKIIAKKVPVIVYSGDVDTCVPFVGTEFSMAAVGLNQTEARRPWLVEKQVAGYVKAYGLLQYATILGAGHMTPSPPMMGRPAQALHMYEQFIQRKPL
jgi:carboxypeptidase C (cathepsin A)